MRVTRRSREKTGEDPRSTLFRPGECRWTSNIVTFGTFSPTGSLVPSMPCGSDRLMVTLFSQLSVAEITE